MFGEIQHAGCKKSLLIIFDIILMLWLNIETSLLFQNQYGSPAYRRYYGETEIIIYLQKTLNSAKTIILVLLFFSMILYIFHSTQKFYEKNYLFYKSIGMYSHKIFCCLIEKEFVKILIICGSYAFFLPDDRIFVMLLQMLWFLFVFFCIYAVVYVSYHWKFLLRVFKTGIYVYIFFLLFSIFLDICDDIQKPRVWSHTNTFILIYNNNGLVEFVSEYLLHPSTLSIGRVAFLYVAVLLLFLRTDNKIVEVRKTRSFRKIQRKNLLHTSKNPVIYFFNYVTKEFFQCFRKKENLFCHIFIYGCYIAAIYIFRNDYSIFMVLAMFFISLLCLEMECFYHADSKSRMWYVLLGESYQRFLVKKNALSLVVVGGVLLIGFTAFSYMNLCQVVLILYFFGSILYWNFYFSGYYVKMEESETILEVLRIFIVWIFFYIPVLNIGLCLFWYKKGKKEWNKIC